jgi:hypothetical protein
MKNKFFNGAASLVLGFMMLACSSSSDTLNEKGINEIDQKALTTMALADSVHDFGVIKEGEKVTYTFKYTNTGEHPLLVSDVKASCGCTLPEWTKDSIAPGKEGLIRVQFNSEGRPGNFEKTITVIANTPEEVRLLKIMGEVTPKPAKIEGPFKK